MINNINIYHDGIKYVLSKHDFSKLKNKTIIVTGINGMIGGAIVDTLNYLNEFDDYNIKIIGLVRNINKISSRFNNYKNLKIIEHDIRDELNITIYADYIINAASNSHPSTFSSDPVGTMVTNFLGTKNLLEYAKKNNCTNFLYVSSGEIYGQGDVNVEAFTEEYRGFIDSTNPRSCYPIGKLSAETLCVSYMKEYNLNTVIARPCHTYGPTQKIDDSRAMSQFILNGINGENIVMKSRGEQVRSYCYVLDCVTGILKILLDGKAGDAYNIANKESILSIADAAKEIASIANTKVIFDIPTDVELAGYNPVTRSVLDGGKLEKLGWIPCYNFNKGITETIKIMK